MNDADLMAHIDPDNPAYFPCDESAQVSMCCRITDKCMPNGLCQQGGSNILWRESCTDVSILEKQINLSSNHRLIFPRFLFFHELCFEILRVGSSIHGAASTRAWKC